MPKTHPTDEPREPVRPIGPADTQPAPEPTDQVVTSEVEESTEREEEQTPEP